MVNYSFDIKGRHAEVIDLLKPLYEYKPHDFKQMCTASRVCVATSDSAVVGFGRAITDGVMQTAIYDVIVADKYKKMGIGRNIVDLLCMQCNARVTILYAEPGSEDFYINIGFSNLRNGMFRRGC